MNAPPIPAVESARPAPVVANCVMRALGQLSQALIITDAQGRLEWVNLGFERLTGWTGAEVLGRPPIEFLRSPGGEPRMLAFVGERLAAGLGFQATVLTCRKDGTPMRVLLDVQPVHDEADRLTGFVASLSDVTLRPETVRQALESASATIWEWNLSAHSLLLAGPMVELLGELGPVARMPEEAILERVHADDRAGFDAWRQALLAGHDPGEIEWRLVASNGWTRWFSSRGQALSRDGANGAVLLACGAHQDISARKRAEDRVQHLAYYDPLTGLYNRAHLISALDRRAREADAAAVLFVDLDRFKQINDTFGHPTGDRVLQEVSLRLGEVVRAGDIAARLGGDEFVLVLPGVGQTVADEVCRRLLVALARPIVVDGTSHHVSASIGVALAPRDGHRADELLRHADIAMYQAKQAGRDACRFFEPAMEATLREAQRLETRLRDALDAGTLTLAYQPIVDARSGRVTACEALSRWTDAELGVVSPAVFIPAAERSGLILRLGEAVLEAACRDARDWRAFGQALDLHVNVSAMQLEAEGFDGIVADVLARTGIAAERLVLEMTESALMQDEDRAVALLERFRARGVRVAIDDFGTGHSSLARLKRLPLDKLKIDGSFIADVPHRPEANQIVSAVLDIARRLRLTVTAEGVETAEQANHLSAAGCHELQGYYLGRPVPADVFARMLRSIGGACTGAAEAASEAEQEAA